MGSLPKHSRLCLLVMTTACLWSQVVEFESGGLKYQTLTKNGLTIMVAELPSNVRGYSVLQVAVSNGSRTTYVVKPEDFLFERSDGSELPAVAARSVVYSLIQKASRADVIRLVTAYEHGIYG